MRALSDIIEDRQPDDTLPHVDCTAAEEAPSGAPTDRGAGGVVDGEAEPCPRDAEDAGVRADPSAGDPNGPAPPPRPTARPSARPSASIRAKAQPRYLAPH